MGKTTSRDDVGPGDRVGVDGRYELLVRVGSGGMGAVYRARDHKLGCERAVKVLDSRYSAIPAFVERFRREAMAASRIAHPNIVSVLDLAEEGERPVFLVMELLEGKTISQLVRGSGRLPWAQVQRYVDQIAAGLGAAHAQGVVHRDVKPGNCLVLPDDQVKVLDFGIAKVTDMPAEVVALTAAGEIIGTCSYMAPEQIRGQVDKRSDIYALGVLMFRMLTGRVPFEHREQDKVLLAHLTEPAPVPSSVVQGLPPGVDELVLRMLAKQPHKRFDGMEELRRVLAGIERGEPVAMDDPTAPPLWPSATAMFEDAPTRAVMREATPGSGMGAGSSEPAQVGRPTINTAPAGSGAFAQLEGAGPGPGPTVELHAFANVGPAGTVALEGVVPVGPAGTVALEGVVPVGPAGTVALEGVVGMGGGTVVLEDPRMPASGGTLVVHGQPVPTAPGNLASVPTPTPAAAPRRLAPLPSASAEPRLTRIATPSSHAGRSGVIRGLVAAFGGIALAVAVVVGVVMWQRNASSGPQAPDAADPAAAAAAIEAEPEPVTADVEAASEPVDVVEAPARLEPVPAPSEPPMADGRAQVRSSSTESLEPSDAETPAREAPAARAATKPKTSRSKTTKGKEPRTASASEPKREPEPTPETSETTPKTGKRKGDLRDPF